MSAVRDHTWYHATPAQQGIWILDRIERLRPTYLIPSVIEFTGPVDHAALVDSVERVLARHPALRSRFRLNTTSLRVEYRTDGEPAEVGLIDARAEGWTEDELARLVEALCYTPFELDDEPPARAEVIKLDGGTTLLVLTVHHIVFDATSRRIVLDEVGALYRDGPDAPLPDRPHPADLLVAPPAADLAERIADAVERLRGAPTTVDLPYDRAPDDELSMLGSLRGADLDAATTEGVLRASAEEGCTPFMTGVALLAGALARRGAQRDFLFSVVWPGRDDPASAEAVGMFMTTLVLRVALDASTTWRDLLGVARTACLETFVDADVPLDALASELDPDRDVGRLPMTPVLVNLAEVPAPIRLAPGVTGRYRPLEPQYSKWDLALFVHVDESVGDTGSAGDAGSAGNPGSPGPGARLRLSLDHPTDLFTESTVDALLAALRRCAHDLARSPEEAVLEPARETRDLTDPAARLDLVRSVWAEVLGHDTFGDDTSFFDAGGDSLRLVVLVERLRELSGRAVRTADLFRAGTARGHAELLTDEAAASTQRPARAGGRDRLLGAVRDRRPS
ncbi:MULTISPECIES: condensation domain-containing protein [Actinosynnema]|uniref:condensation domain-containing protein n=1 Tax=Actinosynnema TaxID=40566 RepID=UPI0020A41617|nr:condensation domain-containing protein [Actinosynnema pretiosum]MCP2098642.1 HxxPF-repeated domain-containing protein [Actinosynnema pretiosum]